jgi:prevent-host-death family protein
VVVPHLVRFGTAVAPAHGVRELNQNTSQVLARVSGGETVEITDRGRPIARLVPVSDDRSTLAKLVVAGRAVPATGTGPVPLSSKLGDEGVDVATTVAAMRDDERW